MSAGKADALEKVKVLKGMPPIDGRDVVRGQFRARQDYVEEAWRIVDPAIQARPPVHVYEPGSWGPAEADGMVPGGWFVARDG